MTLYYTLRRFWFVPQLVERRLSAEGPAVGAGLPADAVAVGRDRDRDVVEPEGRPGLALPHDALLRLCLGLVVRGVDPEDLRALLLPAHLLNLEVISGASLAALLVITILPELGLEDTFHIPGLGLSLHRVADDVQVVAMPPGNMRQWHRALKSFFLRKEYGMASAFLASR
eukprot:s8941_g1.t1